MTDSDEKQRGLDATMENEASRDLSPMVQISIKEYDKLKERSRYITDKDLISMIDKLEFFVKELRKHIVRIDIDWWTTFWLILQTLSLDPNSRYKAIWTVR